MSYHRYDLPKQPRTPLDGPLTVFGFVTISLIFLLIVILAWVA